MISAGSVSTFCSKITLPASSTTHTDVSFTDTSRPTKCTILSLLPRGSRSPDLNPLLSEKRKGTCTHHRCVSRPPRYTICGSERRRSPECAATGEMRLFRPLLRPRSNREGPLLAGVRRCGTDRPGRERDGGPCRSRYDQVGRPVPTRSANEPGTRQHVKRSAADHC
jgi:hypothetical protein